MTHDITKIWDATAADVHVGADAGTEIGFNGEVSISIERTFLDVTASQTGAQPLDRRRLSEVYRVAIDFKQVGDANYFTDWWLTGNPAGKLHPGSLGASAPTKRVRIHPKIMAADTSKDFVFERLAFDRGPSMVMNGRNEHVHRIEFISLPVAASLPTVDVGSFGFTPP